LKIKASARVKVYQLKEVVKKQLIIGQAKRLMKMRLIRKMKKIQQKKNKLFLVQMLWKNI